jgi:aspartate 4-decarboxylase
MKSRLAEISPFAFKDLLVAHARVVRGPDSPLLDASRGAANWQQREVQLAWHVLGLYADYCYGAVGTPPSVRLLTPSPLDHKATFMRFYEGIMELRESLTLGVEYLLGVWSYLSTEVFPERSEASLIDSFTRAISGASYPSPATLEFVAPIMARYLAPLLLDDDLDLAQRFRVHLAPGVTAALGQVVQTLAHSGLLAPGDKVAVLKPGYRPLRDLFAHQHGCELVELQLAAGMQVAAAEWDRLLDPAVRLLALASPGNPVPYALPASCLNDLGEVMAQRPDLLILGDFVYAHLLPTPADNPLRRWPKQTIGFYGPAKDFGLAGARLGAALIHEECVVNDLLARRAPEVAQVADERYAGRLWHPDQAGLAERLAEESNFVAFGHMAGISTCDQVLMCLCACYDAVATRQAEAFFSFVRGELQRRERTLYLSLGMVPPDAGETTSSRYAALIDLLEVARDLGEDVSRGLALHDIWEFLFHLAHREGVIMMPGQSFGGGPWSVRICLPSLGEPEYRQIGEALRRTLKDLSQQGRCGECQVLWAE